MKQPTTIDSEIERHFDIPHVKEGLFDEFSEEVETELIKAHSKKGFVTDIDPLEGVQLTQRKIRYYKESLHEAVKYVKQLFIKENIEFRLYDIDFVMHDVHRICFFWRIHDKDYGFEITFEDQGMMDFIPYLVRIVEIEAGNILRGDFTPDHCRELEQMETIPEWYLTIISQRN
jgi:hypothetical protein